VTSPFWVPHCLLDDDLNRGAYFPGHPYARRWGDEEVRSVSEINDGRPFADPGYLKPWSARLLLDNGNDFGGLNRTGAALVFDTDVRFGALARWDYYSEDLGAGRRDHTTLGDAYLTYRFAQGSAAQFHAGIGGRWRYDDRTTNGGVSFLYGATFYPIEPLVVSASVDLGHLDRQFVIRARTSAGWQVGRCELLGGYDFLRLGSVNLQGPFLGVRLWF
jgi:hypothetical protein